MSTPVDPASTHPAPAPASAAAAGAPGDRADVLVAVAAAITVVSWASAFVGIRALAGAFGAGELALGRLAVGAAALGAALLVRRGWVRPTAREGALLLLCGLGWFAVYNVALNAAEQHLDAGTAAMLVGVGPLLIALGAAAVLGERLHRWLLGGLGVALAGAVVIGVATSRSGDADAVGVLLALVAAVTYAVGVLAQKVVLRRLPALQVTWLACTTGAVACLPFAPGLVEQVALATPGARAGLLYLGLVPTALAFGTWAYALSRTGAARLGVSTYLVPVLAVAASWPLLGEVPPLAALLGGALCLAGVALSRRGGGGGAARSDVRGAAGRP